MNLWLWLLIGAFLRACWHISFFRPKKSFLPYWDYPLGIKRPPLDAPHIYGGLFAVWMVLVFILQPGWVIFQISDRFWLVVVHLVAYWLYFFYCFSLLFHIILIKPGYRDWSYLMPLIKKK